MRVTEFGEMMRWIVDCGLWIVASLIYLSILDPRSAAVADRRYSALSLTKRLPLSAGLLTVRVTVCTPLESAAPADSLAVAGFRVVRSFLYSADRSDDSASSDRSDEALNSPLKRFLR